MMKRENMTGASQIRWHLFENMKTGSKFTVSSLKKDLPNLSGSTVSSWISKLDNYPDEFERVTNNTGRIEYKIKAAFFDYEPPKDNARTYKKNDVRYKMDVKKLEELRQPTIDPHIIEEIAYLKVALIDAYQRLERLHVQLEMAS